MIIPPNTKMLLFRYNDYARKSFIDEHRAVINNNGYVWMMRLGKRTSPEKLRQVTEAGGFVVLKSPKKNGDHYYLAHYTDVASALPDDSKHMPDYYNKLIQEGYLYDTGVQVFKIDSIFDMTAEQISTLRLQLNGKPVDEVIKQTRTAVMFIENVEQLEIA